MAINKPWYKIWNSDCLSVLSKETLEYDIVITDLPYGVTQNKIDKVLDLNKMWDLIGNKPFITTTQQPFTTDLINSNRNNFKYMWYWDKVIKTGHLNAKKQPMRHIEEIAVFNKTTTYNPIMEKGKKLHHAKGESKATRNQNLNYGKTQDNYINEERKFSDMKYPKQLITIQKPKSAVNKPLNHATEKPIELMEYLIKTYTNPGDTVLDLTMGSGTTGVACLKLGRNFIGMEIDPEIYKIAKKRIEEVNNVN